MVLLDQDGTREKKEAPRLLSCKNRIILMTLMGTALAAETAGSVIAAAAVSPDAETNG